MTPIPNGQSPDAVREAVATPNLRQQVRDCIGETVPLRRRWVSAIMDRVVTPLVAQRDAAIARAEEAERKLVFGETTDESALRNAFASGAQWAEKKLLAEVATLTADLAQAKAQVAGYRKALEKIAEEHDAGRHDGLPEACPAHEADVMWAIARAALVPTEQPHDD